MNVIDRLEELAAKATGRPWRVAGHDDWTYVAREDDEEPAAAPGEEGHGG